MREPELHPGVYVDIKCTSQLQKRVLCVTEASGRD